MGNSQWGSEGPPPEAYSRVTNPERFAPLYEAATAILKRLELEFDVERAEGYGLDPELERRYKLARSTVSLTPRDGGAAPLVVAFSSFPGVHVRFGRSSMVAFPTCGCDACDENAEDEVQRLMSMVKDVTAGRFREAVRFRVPGVPSNEWEVWSVGDHFARQGSPLDVDRGGDPSSHDYKPWPRRT